MKILGDNNITGYEKKEIRDMNGMCSLWIAVEENDDKKVVSVTDVKRKKDM